MADTRLKSLQEELEQKEEELRDLNAKKKKDKYGLIYNLSILVDPAQSHDEKIKKLKEEIVALKSKIQIEIENNKGLFDKLADACNVVGNNFHSLIKTIAPDAAKQEQIEQMNKHRERRAEIERKYHSPNRKT